MVRLAGLGVLGFLGILVIRAATQPVVAPLAPAVVDEAAVARHLAAIVKRRTVSTSLDSPAPAAELEGLHADLAAFYPKVHGALSREIIGEDESFHVRAVIDDARVVAEAQAGSRTEPSKVSGVETRGFGLLASTTREVFPGTVVAPGWQRTSIGSSPSGWGPRTSRGSTAKTSAWGSPPSPMACVFTGVSWRRRPRLDNQSQGRHNPRPPHRAGARNS